MSEHLRVFLGWDSKEPVTFAVAQHSILTRAQRPLSVTPLVQASLRASGIYRRERKPSEATEFALTRFLCPYLADYEGYSLFLDSDVLVQTDLQNVLLYPLIDPGKAVYVCQHEYVPKDVTKFDGHEQTRYPRKNWTSVMLMDNARCSMLTPEYVNNASGLALHRFHWLPDEQIGRLPLTWNWLVGEYEPNPEAHILHFTRGAPCFPGYQESDQADRWCAEYEAMLAPATSVREALVVGASVRGR